MITLERTTFTLPAGTFHALVGGEGPPLLYLHGFPDHPPTARAFLERVARTRRVVAPWLRGYHPSPRVGPYDLETLAADVLAFIDQLAPRRGSIDLVGHDWGAVITYAVCQQAPDRVRRAVTMSVPHPLTFVRQLRNPEQALRSAYMALFQLPGAGAIVRAANLVDRLWGVWSPKLHLDEHTRADLHRTLAASLPAPLEYYRAAARPVGAARARLRRARLPIEVPLLQLHGADDACILQPTADDAHLFTGPRELAILDGLGHFLHIEAPDDIAARVDAWLAM